MVHLHGHMVGFGEFDDLVDTAEIECVRTGTQVGIGKMPIGLVIDQCKIKLAGQYIAVRLFIQTLGYGKISNFNIALGCKLLQ